VGNHCAQNGICCMFGLILDTEPYEAAPESTSEVPEPRWISYQLSQVRLPWEGNAFVPSGPSLHVRSKRSVCMSFSKLIPFFNTRFGCKCCMEKYRIEQSSLIMTSSGLSDMKLNALAAEIHSWTLYYSWPLGWNVFHVPSTKQHLIGIIECRKYNHSALTLLDGQLEGISVCKNVAATNCVISFWMCCSDLTRTVGWLNNIQDTKVYNYTTMYVNSI